MKGESRGLPGKTCDDGGIQQEGVFHGLEIQSSLLYQTIFYYRKCSNFSSEQGSRKKWHLEQDWKL